MPAHSESRGRETGPRLAGAGPTVLVVDDDPWTRVHTAQVLRQAGFEVLESLPGAPAEAVLEHTPVDAVVGWHHHGEGELSADC